jgi:hypothetical protein
MNLNSTNAWITTFTGLRVQLPDLNTHQVRLVDIAHSLGMQCRYLGQSNKFYSIAEHSVLVKELARKCGEGELIQRCALFHDAHEAYLGDFPSPFKDAVPGLREFEARVESPVRRAFNLPEHMDQVWKIVKRYDNLALHYEASHLLKNPGWIDWDCVTVARQCDLPLWCHDAEYAKHAFLTHVRDTGIGLGGGA